MPNPSKKEEVHNIKYSIDTNDKFPRNVSGHGRQPTNNNPHFLSHFPFFPFLNLKTFFTLPHSTAPMISITFNLLFTILSVYPSKLHVFKEASCRSGKEKDSLSLIKNHLSLFSVFCLSLLVCVSHNERCCRLLMTHFSFSVSPSFVLPFCRYTLISSDIDYFRYFVLLKMTQQLMSRGVSSFGGKNLGFWNFELKIFQETFLCLN